MPLFGRKRLLVKAFTPEGDADTKALVAAAERVVYESAQDLPRLQQPWQQDAYKYYYQIGEIHYAAQFYARAFSQLRLFVGRMDENGEVEEVDAGSPEAKLFDRVQDPGGGRSRLLGQIGRLMFLVGEGFLTVTEPPGMPERWEFLSGNELQVKADNTYVRYRAPGLPPVTYRSAGDDAQEPGVGTAIVYRFWNPDPQFSQMADSSMKAVLDLCDELLLLTLSVRARVKSRLANAGILLVSSDVSFPTPTGVDDENSKQDPFQEMLQNAMVTAVQQPGSAAQVVPLVLRVAGHMISENAEQQVMRHIKLFDPKETYPEEGLRAELIRRIAQGLDMPPEMLLGMTDANHWTAWQIDDQTWTAHLQPAAQQMVDNFTASYLRPAAKAEGINGWESLVVGYDAAEVVNHPDRLKDALEIYNSSGGVGLQTIREAGGFNDGDAQTEEERSEWLAIKLRDPLLLDESEGGDQPSTGQDNAADTISVAPSEALMEDNLPENENVNASINGKAAYVVGAAQVSLARSRELAGSRIRTKVSAGGDKGCEECVSKIDGVDNHAVASVLGFERTEELMRMAPRQLVAGGSKTFVAAAEALGVDAIEARRIGQMVEEFAAKTLFEGNPGSVAKQFGKYLEARIR